MTLVAVLIIRVVAWLILITGLVVAFLIIVGTTVIPALSNLPRTSTATSILTTLVPALIVLAFSAFYWALLICIASITDDLNAIRHR